MKSKTLGPKAHHIVSVLAISFISLFGLEALVYINNLYQMQIYVMASGWIYLFLLFWLYFVFDLHFKDEKHLDADSIVKAFGQRFRYFSVWNHLRYFQNFLILPGILYWSSIVLIGINFGHQKLQHFIAIATSLALIVVYSLFKQIFHSKDLPIKDSHFVAMTYTKVYASWLVYAGSLGIVWYYCFPPWVFYLVIFMVTLMLLYQALFQFAELKLRNIYMAVAVALGMTVISIFVYKEWNVNYFSAGLFMTAIYNFLWNTMYQTIKKTLTPQRFMEQLILMVILLIMVFGVTNFRAKIERCVF